MDGGAGHKAMHRLEPRDLEKGLSGAAPPEAFGGPSDARYFFVVGCPRSGTTLLSVLLDRHSRLCVPPETSFFVELAPRLVSGGRDVSEALRNWPRLGELGLNPAAVVGRLDNRRPAPEAVLAAVLDLYAAARGKLRCGEKTPQHLWHVPSILRLFPESTVFCLVRDGRDVALSLAAMPWWLPRSLADAADLWARSADLVAEFERAHPARFKVVRYEELVTRPAGVLATVLADLGEDFEPRQFDLAVQSGVVLPRSAAWKGQSLGAVTGDELGRRRSLATAEETQFLERVLGDRLRRYGYGP